MKAKARLRVGITPELRRNTLTAGLTRDRYTGNTIYLYLDRVTNKKYSHHHKCCTLYCLEPVSFQHAIILAHLSN